MSGRDNLSLLFVVWAFAFQIILIIHFALRKVFFVSYTMRIGWWVYSLCIPAVVISIVMLRGGRPWYFCLGGFLSLLWSIFGYWADYISTIPWRGPIYLPVLIPYVILYLSTIMFYWWPLSLIKRKLWFIYAVLFIIGTIFNIISH